MAPIRCLMAPGSPTSANAYFSSLYHHVSVHDVTISEFNRREAVTARPDVIHIHFPEYLVDYSRGRLRVLLDGLKVLAVLLVARLRGCRLIWSAHNLRAHDSRHPRLEKAFMRTFLLLVDRVILLSSASLDQLSQHYPGILRKDRDVIPLGHYRGVMPHIPDRSVARAESGFEPTTRVVLNLGQIRVYKSVPETITAFRNQHGDANLVVAGKVVADAGYDTLIRERAGTDSRIRLLLRRVSDEEVASLHACADIAVLPYTEGSALNSSAAMLALSLNCPVVVRDTPVMRDLQATVGDQWVHLFRGGPHEAVQLALTARLPDRERQPDLSAYGWEAIGVATRRCYDEAMGS